MKTNLKRILSVICALALCIGLLPMSALAAGGNSAQNEYVKFDYSEEIAVGTDFTVRVQDASGTQLGNPITVSDFPLAVVTNVTITCLKSEYEIMSVETDSGSTTITLPDNQKSTYTCNIDSTLSGGEILVTLCEPFEPPEIVDEIGETAYTIVYRIQEPQLLKILHDAKVDIDDIDINNIDVQARYVSNTSLGATSTFNAIRRGANTIPYYQGDDEISGLDPDSHPNNIRQLEITYSDPQGEHTVIIPSGDLRYVGDGIRTYEIEARDQSEHIVAFYIESGAQLTTWQLYDVKFVKDGQHVGLGNMPKDPTYPEHLYLEFTGWTEGYNGGKPFLYNTPVTGDTVVYAQKKSTTNISSEIHVINRDGELINRYLELYNAQNPENPIDADDIDMGSVKITVYGQGDEHTNPDYMVSGVERNRWEEENGNQYAWYKVYNYLTGVGAQENESIPVNEISKIQIDATDQDGQALPSITINRGAAAGEFEATTGAGGAAGQIIEIYINEPPTAPTEDEMTPDDPDDPGLLGEGAVKVECVTENSDHTEGNYALIANTSGENDSYKIGEVTATADGNYICVITVYNGPYIDQYGTDTKKMHSLQTGETQSQEITLTWDSDNNCWAPDNQKLPIIFKAVCDNQGSGEDLNGTDVTVQVYVNGNPVTDPLTYVDLSRKSSDPDSKGWHESTPDENGIITCDFDYEDDGYDCVDINVALKNPEGVEYVLQGVTSYQSHGEKGTNNVESEDDGTYTVDNVTGKYDSKYGADVKIYLRTKYTVKYYENEQESQAVTDPGAYIVKEDVTSTTPEEKEPGKGQSAWMNWKNDSLSTTITVKDLPSVTGTQQIAGWWLNDQECSADGTLYGPKTEDHKYVPVETAIDGLTDKVIKFYAKVTDSAQPDVSVEKKLTSITHKDGTVVNADNITDDTVLLVGDKLTWTITVTNSGGGKAEGLKLTDTLTAIDAEGESAPRKATVVADDPQNNDPENFSVETGRSATFTATYTVTEADKGLTLKNTAAVGDVDAGDDPSDETENPVENPKVSIVKTLSTVNGSPYTEGGKVNVGDKLTYEIKVTNTGNVKLGDVVITDSLWSPKTGVTSVMVGDAKQELDAPNGYVYHIIGLDVGNEVTITYTYTVQDSDAGKTIKNTAAVSGDDIEDNDGGTEEVEVTNPDMSVEKALTAINDGEVPNTFFTVDEDDKLTYTITVKNIGTEKLDATVSDSLWGIKHGVTSVKVDGAEQPLDVPNGYVCHINGIGVGETVTIIYTYTVTEQDVKNGSIANDVTVNGGEDGTDTDTETVWTGDVTITPANITVYTGGNPYSSIVDADGNTITETDGLPEPGYHLELPQAVVTWLQDQTQNLGAEDLSQYLTFTYDGSDSEGKPVTRTWALAYVGVYDTDKENNEPTRYVYSLKPAKVGDTEIPVRLVYFDDTNNNGEFEEEEVKENDDIPMNVDTVFDTYSMTINPGGLTQSEIKAVFTVGEGENKESITCNINIEPGTLTIRSVTDQGTTTNTIEADGDAVASNTLTAVAGDDVTFYVNDSKVPIVEKDRVGLLVDSVSNNSGFNASMGADAISEVRAKGISLSNAFYQAFYLDLVDTKNGNAVVTMDTDNELTIYWPVPTDAASNSEFHIVHYTDMNRTEVIANSQLGEAATETHAVTRDGDHLTFTTDSFSPFVLVYEKESQPVNPPYDDDDDDDNGGSRPSHRPSRPNRDDEPEDLNTEDHVAYLIGFTDGTIRPEADISRAEVATIFFRLLTDEARETYWSQTNSYSDVAPDAWYNNAVSTLSRMGILDGYLDGTFRPNAPITRSEFTKIAVSFFDYAAEEYSYEGWFSDVQGGEWFVDYLTAAVEYGLIEGMPDGTFRPLDNITRAEACTIVNRTLGREPHEDYLLSERRMNTWPDNSASAWYYAAMQEATNSHDYAWVVINENKDDEMEVEEWTNKLDERDWAELERTWSDAYDAPGGEVMD